MQYKSRKYDTIREGRQFSIKKLVFRYLLKTGVADNDLPSITVYGSTDGDNATLASNIVLHEASDNYTADCRIIDGKDIFKFWFTIDNFENIIRLKGQRT